MWTIGFSIYIIQAEKLPWTELKPTCIKEQTEKEIVAKTNCIRIEIEKEIVTELFRI